VFPFDFMFVVVWLPSCVQLFVTTWTAACQAPLSFTMAQRLLRFMSTEMVMLSNHLILCYPFSFFLQSFPAMVSPVVRYGCESWTIKKAEHQRIDAFELWCWRRLLRVPWTARRSNQSILKEISPGFIGRTEAEAETPIL